MNDTREKTAVDQILLDRAQRFFGRQKIGRWPGGRPIALNERRLLHVHFQNGVTLVKFWSTRKISETKKQSGHHAEDHHPDLLDQ